MTPEHDVDMGRAKLGNDTQFPAGSGAHWASLVPQSLLGPRHRRCSEGAFPTHPSCPVGTHLPGFWVSHLKQVKLVAPALPSLSCYGEKETHQIGWGYSHCRAGTAQTLLGEKHLQSHCLPLPQHHHPQQGPILRRLETGLLLALWMRARPWATCTCPDISTS